MKIKWFKRKRHSNSADHKAEANSAASSSGQTAAPSESPEALNFTQRLTPELSKNVFRYLDLKTKVRCEQVCKGWREVITETYRTEDKWSVWLYVIFRESHLSGHDRMTVRVTEEGPIFWNKSIIYAYMCSCHVYERHEPQWTSLFHRIGGNVRRLCLVSSPVRSCFLTNDFYSFCLDTFVNLEMLYLRELDLETVATSTIEKMASSKTLRRIILHNCVKYDTLTDFHRLNDRLMLLKGALHGLEELLRSKDAYPESCEIEQAMFNGLLISSEDARSPSTMD